MTPQEIDIKLWNLMANQNRHKAIRYWYKQLMKTYEMKVYS